MVIFLTGWRSERCLIWSVEWCDFPLICALWEKKKKKKPSAASDIPRLKTHKKKREVIIKASEQFMKNKESRKDDFYSISFFLWKCSVEEHWALNKTQKGSCECLRLMLSSNDLTSAAPQQVETCTREWGLSFGTPRWRFEWLCRDAFLSRVRRCRLVNRSGDVCDR